MIITVDFIFMFQMVQDLKKENFDLKLRLYMEQKQNEVRTTGRLHYISPSNLRLLLLLLLSLQLRDLCPYASIQGLIRPSPPRSRRDQSDHYYGLPTCLFVAFDWLISSKFDFSKRSDARNDLRRDVRSFFRRS